MNNDTISTKKHNHSRSIIINEGKQIGVLNVQEVNSTQIKALDNKCRTFLRYLKLLLLLKLDRVYYIIIIS